MELLEGTFLGRRKRFFADIRLLSGEVVVAHCPNPGSMKTCLFEGARVILSKSSNPKRKLALTLEMIQGPDSWIGVNTLKTNDIVFQAFQDGFLFREFSKKEVFREVVFKDSRFDFLFKNEQGTLWLEVKNVSLRIDRWAAFPDSVTKRGQKHLEGLMELVRTGRRAGIFFLVQREDVDAFRPALEIDPQYAALLVQAFLSGVEIYACGCKVSPEGIFPCRFLEVSIP